jgi:predicted acyltransferase (DUF342 family)
MNSRLFVSSDASFNSNLYVGSNTIQKGDVSMNSRLFVSSDASFNSNLYVGSNTIQKGDVSMNSRLFVSSDASFNSNLYVGSNTIQKGDVSMNSRLFIGGDVSMNSRLFVTGNIYMNGILVTSAGGGGVSSNYFATDVSMASRLFVNSDVSMNARLFVGNDISLNGKIFVASSTASTSVTTGALIVSGGAGITGNIYGGNVYSSSFNVTSDRRIKQNILSIDGSFATHILRNIHPASFDFIDSYTQPFRTKWGFVAQDVKSYLDFCGETTTQFIPNIYDDALFLNSTTLQLLHKSTGLFDASFMPFSLRLYDSFKRLFDCQVQSITNDTTFVLSDAITDCSSGSVFVYGQEVNDFHTLNHDSIFTVVTAAVKEMDQKIQDQNLIIQKQQTEIDFLKKQMNLILLRLDDR